MWVLIARAPPPDMHVWPGRRLLAAIDAVAWPLGWIAFVMLAPARTGVVGPVVVALCLAAAVLRLHRAVGLNHRYRFTTWRWGRWVLLLLLVGYALKLAILLAPH